MNAENLAKATRSERIQDSHGKRRKIKQSNTHGGHKQARAGWSCDDTKDSSIGTTGEITRLLPGRYRVTMPHGRTRYVAPAGKRPRS